MQIVLIVGIVLVILLLLAMWPGRGRRLQMQQWIDTPVAHRGLHDNGGAAPENSMAAYKKAVEKGYGIELDVRLSADGELVCMHDRSLVRAAGVDKLVDALTWKELQSLHLFQSEEGIPRFREVLRMVGGRVPIIMEVKAESLDMAKAVSKAAAEMLDTYEGAICMESFHPGAVRWFKENRPAVIRGQLAEHFKGLPYPHGIGAFFLSCCMLNFATRPDFIAYNVKHRQLLRFRILHDVFHAVCVAWTVKSRTELFGAADSFEVFIFEGFEPEVSK